MTESLWALAPEAAPALFAELAANLRPFHAASPSSPAVASPPSSSIVPPLSAAALPSAQNPEDMGYSLRQGVAVISINGAISRQAVYSWYTGQALTQGQDSIAAALAHAMNNPAARAILLDVNSPGGAVPGTKELADAIAIAAASKPMAAYANGLMASAAMWLGAATGRVLAPLTATLGSVGVIMVHSDLSKLNERWGVAYSYITGGKLKSAGNQDNPLSDEARAMFQRQVSQIHEIFKADVSRGLKLSAPAEQWAEGQTMLAEDAKALGLVSGIVRDLEAAITLLSQEAVMDLKSFAAQHPELLEQIRAEARAEALKESETALAAAVSRERENTLLMVKSLGGEALQAQLTRLIEAKFAPEQVALMASMLGSAAKNGAPATDPAKDAILKALRQATPGAIEGGAPPAADAKSKLVADAERRAANS